MKNNFKVISKVLLLILALCQVLFVSCYNREIDKEIDFLKSEYNNINHGSNMVETNNTEPDNTIQKSAESQILDEYETLSDDKYLSKKDYGRIQSSDYIITGSKLTFLVKRKMFEEFLDQNSTI